LTPGPIKGESGPTESAIKLAMSMRPPRIIQEKDIVVDVVRCDAEPLLANARCAVRTIDVSELGLKASVYVPLPPHTRIALRLTIDGEAFDLQGEVRWSREAGEILIGVRIDDTAPGYARWREMLSATNTGSGDSAAQDS
jgi:hypothetical protein